ncbi:MAG TPA: hypothetical protein VF546_15530 [Pyrinomonadaceae bacterium]|jgi:hypothetical protein
MKYFRQTVSLALVLALLSIGLTAQAQRRGYGYGNSARIDQLIRNVESGAARFRTTLDAALNNNGSVYGSRRADNINTYVQDFDQALGQLRTRFDRRTARAADVQLVLDRATLIDNFLNRRNNRLDPSVRNDWVSVRSSLNELARAYNINWAPGQNAGNYPTDNGPYGDQPTYDNRPTYGNPTYGNPTNGTYATLTGTYRLDTAASDDARQAAQNATRSLPWRNRQGVVDTLMTRLEAPDMIAIEQRGRTVTIASSRAPQITFEADGRQRVEQMPSGRSVRAVATLSGDQLTVSTTGDRGNDFNVTFDPDNNGDRLYVTRRISDVNLAQPVVVRSVYTRTDTVARFDIYNGSTYPTTGGVSTSNDTFIIPNNTTLVARLNEDLTTRDAREGQRFTLTVREPSQYDGATIEGTVGRVQRSGRVTGRSEMALNFDSIRLRDGRTYRFAGMIDSVRDVNGETVRVDNEGTVQENNSRGNTTAQRAAIGTAVGAIIGAIAGGGKGAAIGAILGAGGGAGSVYVQGSDDLELRSGTEMVVRSTGPDNR